MFSSNSCGEAIYAGVQVVNAQLVRGQARDSRQVARTRFRHGEQRLGHHAFEWRRDAQVWRTRNAEQLIQPVRNEDHLVTRDVVEEPIVIASDRVTVPMDQQRFRGGEGHETLDIQRRFQPCEPLRQNWFTRGPHQIRQVGAVLGIFS